MEFIEIFNNREKAIIIWLLIAIFFMMFKEDIRKSMLNILKILFSKLLFVFLAMFLYVAATVFLLHEIGFWQFTMLKSTIFWIFSVALIMLFNYKKPRV